MDHIVRGTAAAGLIRAFAIDATETVRTAAACQKTNPLTITALGRLLVGAQMMGFMLKGDDEQLALHVLGDGPLQSITAVANNRGEVKGLVGNADAWIDLTPQGGLNVGGAVGEGSLMVVRTIPHVEPFCSQVPLVTGEIGDDLAYYYVMSEQVPTSIGLGVQLNSDLEVSCAGGFIVQLMPGYDDATVDALEANLTGVKSVCALMAEGMTPNDILAYLLRGMDYQKLAEAPAGWSCDCSTERALAAVRALGPDELRDMIQKGEPAEIVCPYCKTRYTVSVDQLEEMLG